jgi:hypothetical protein
VTLNNECTRVELIQETIVIIRSSMLLSYPVSFDDMWETKDLVAPNFADELRKADIPIA